MSADALDMELAPLDYMRVRVIDGPVCPEQARWASRRGTVIHVDKKLGSWAAVRLDRQVRIRYFETQNLRVEGESPSRALMLRNGYTAVEAPISPTAPPKDDHA